MKNIKVKIVLLVFLLVISGLIAFLAGKVSGENSRFKEPVKSPSDKYEYMKVYGKDNARYYKILIVNKDDENKCFLIDSFFYVRFSSKISWGDKDTLWINSSDIGVFYWIFENDRWIEKVPDETSANLAPDGFY